MRSFQKGRRFWPAWTVCWYAFLQNCLRSCRLPLTSSIGRAARRLIEYQWELDRLAQETFETFRKHQNRKHWQNCNEEAQARKKKESKQASKQTSSGERMGAGGRAEDLDGEREVELLTSNQNVDLRTSTRKTKDANEPRQSKAGLNLGKATKKLYQKARIKVLEREAERVDRGLVFSGETPGVQRETPEYKCFKHYHYLHGKVYDLREFYKQHPGGQDILRMSAGMPDSTALFESYHAFANYDWICKQLEKYEVTSDMDPEAIELAPAPFYTFKDDGFYKTLLRKVRKKFGARSDRFDESVCANVKADQAWAVKVGVQVFFNLLFYTLAFILRLPTPAAMLMAFLAGFFQIQWGFCVFHDASHFAIASRNHWANTFFTRLWSALSLWEGRTWMMHHVVLHHSHTGSPQLDPDVQVSF